MRRKQLRSQCGSIQRAGVPNTRMGPTPDNEGYPSRSPLPHFRRVYIETTMHRSLFLCALALLPARGFAQVQFNRDIRPIMAETCFRCHGPDKSSRMAGMRLDIREEALKPTARGVIPIVPGDPDKSAIVQRIFAAGAGAARIMPPAFAHKELTQAQKETIRRWVAEGAKYEGHWAYQPIRRPAVPEIAKPQAPIRNPIDAFIQARLARES